jgi:hypothetical protein
MYTWTSGDGGVNIDDVLCLFSSNGEVVLYSGVDPDSDFNLAGIFRFDRPMSKHSVINYGGELYVLISTGLVPMSTLLKVETDHLGNTDKTIFSEFFQASFRYRDRPGWSVLLNPSSGRLICNTPMGSDNSYRQMVRFMPNTAWATWSGLASRCWAWIDDRVFFGSDDGKVYEINPRYLNDSDGTPTGSKPIRADVQTAWSTYGSPGIKQFKMVLPYIITDGLPRPSLDVRVDYDDAAPSGLCGWWSASPTARSLSPVWTYFSRKGASLDDHPNQLRTVAARCRAFSIGPYGDRLFFFAVHGPEVAVRDGTRGRGRDRGAGRRIHDLLRSAYNQRNRQPEIHDEKAFARYFRDLLLACRAGDGDVPPGKREIDTGDQASRLSVRGLLPAGAGRQMGRPGVRHAKERVPVDQGSEGEDL